MPLNRRSFFLAGAGALLAGCAVRGRSAGPAFSDGPAEVTAALARAGASGKLGLVILGGAWCHDTEALISRMEAPALARVLSAGFETARVDVGYLDKGFETARRFGLPIYTHTPTVLIVDPQTERLVNAHDHWHSRDAAKWSAAKALRYFEAKARREDLTPVLPAALTTERVYINGIAQVDEFEMVQVRRIEAGYAVLGPKLAARSPDLTTLWAPLSKMRYRFPDDMWDLRRQVRRQVEAGAEGVELTFPDYRALPWEGRGA